MEAAKVIILINCKDQPNIIATVTSFVANNGGNIVKKSSIYRIVASNMTLIPESISCDWPFKKIVCSSHIENRNKVVWNLLGNILPNESGSLRYSTMVK